MLIVARRANLLVLLLAWSGIASQELLRRGPQAAPGIESARPLLEIDYPRAGSVFPPGIVPPQFEWRDESAATSWRIQFHFPDGYSISFKAAGPRPEVGEIDTRCVSPNNEVPALSRERAKAHTWRPDARSWSEIQRHSLETPARVEIDGTDGHSSLSSAAMELSTSRDPVGAPIFYRDVPLMPASGEKGVIKPLASSAIHLIQWRLKSIDQAGSRVVLEEMHTCANCHSFSRDGKTLGIDMDGPQNDKGLYAAVPLRPRTVIRTSDMIQWNPSLDPRAAVNRVGFMSQVSPDGRYLLTMLGSQAKPAQDKYYVANFKDYRFLQVFYPTRGILYWYDRRTGKRQPLPGADDPNYVQTNGVWSPDGKWIVFARARAVDPYPAGRSLATRANDPNEVPIQYDLYRIPFNDGRGGSPEPIAGASGNGMSNSFPKISPDGKWIVFVEAHNGEVMRPDGKLYIVPFEGGAARLLRANLSPMNSWHSWSPNGHWLVFSSKGDGPYTRMYLTHIDSEGNDTPAVVVEGATAANRAVNLPEFVNIPYDGLQKIETPAVEMYARFDHAAELTATGQDAEAIKELEALAQSVPDDPRVWNNLGAALIRTGHCTDAVPDLRKALELNPEYALVHSNLAHALECTEDYEEALREYQRAVEAVPDSGELRVSFGRALYLRGYVDLARQEIAKAEEIDPSLPQAHNEMGILLLKSGQESAGEAEKEFLKALELDPHLGEAANNLGTLYGGLGRDSDAEKMFRLALQDDPSMTRAMVNLAATLASQSRLADAEIEVRRALAIEPGNREAIELLHMIQRAENSFKSAPK